MRWQVGWDRPARYRARLRSCTLRCSVALRELTTTPSRTRLFRLVNSKSLVKFQREPNSPRRICGVKASTFVESRLPHLRQPSIRAWAKGGEQEDVPPKFRPGSPAQNCFLEKGRRRRDGSRGCVRTWSMSRALGDAPDLIESRLHSPDSS